MAIIKNIGIAMKIDFLVLSSPFNITRYSIEAIKDIAKKIGFIKNIENNIVLKK